MLMMMSMAAAVTVFPIRAIGRDGVEAFAGRMGRHSVGVGVVMPVRRPVSVSMNMDNRTVAMLPHVEQVGCLAQQRETQEAQDGDHQPHR